MRPRHIRSHSRSTSVTRSIAPFLSTLKPDSRPDTWMSPARRTMSTAVARKTGSGGGTGGVLTGADALDHHDFHPAFGRAPEVHPVHEAANQEDAAAAGLQQILGGERIGQRGGIE